ncbi:adenosylcobinamide-phosphate synthase CbiB [Thermosulfurimonas marina]|uniref:adenosylcobinamide-phosphate synthase CbiB n=1 Tax=Thermosulfurimonas marina TaxID=2047767 RepID=UPI00144A7B0B|nr:adenosylcobinamide-phosphate synthase CbiB [Thermosulfurimonas marina]
MGGRGLYLLLAVLLDRLLGDPSFGHPVRLIGFLGEAGFRVFKSLRALGGLLTLFFCGGLFVGLVWGSVKGVPWLEPLWLFYFLALTSLEREVGQVFEALKGEGLSAARKRLRYLVSRRVELLDETGVIRGALETLAENFNDGFCGPLFWYVVGGLPGTAFYKVVETLDSMFGYPYGPYRAFGWPIARLDDLLNLVPARLSAVFLALAAPFCGGSFFETLRVALRDAPAHPSPNAGWPEAALAGALGISLGGPIPYPRGWEERAWLGEGLRAPRLEDYSCALRLTRLAALWALATALLVFFF